MHKTGPTGRANLFTLFFGKQALVCLLVRSTSKSWACLCIFGRKTFKVHDYGNAVKKILQESKVCRIKLKLNLKDNCKIHSNE